MTVDGVVEEERERERTRNSELGMVYCTKAKDPYTNQEGEKKGEDSFIPYLCKCFSTSACITYKFCKRPAAVEISTFNK